MATSDDLRTLADAHGIQVQYWSASGQDTTLPDETLRKLLAALDVPTESDEDLESALRQLAAERARLLPPTIVATEGHEWRLPAGLRDVVVELEDGGSLEVEGALPADLPLGWHVVRGRDAAGAEITSAIIAAPARLPEPARGWGWQIQLYGLRSSRSWGMGDAADLRSFVEHAAELGADAVLVNPFHAPTPVSPLQNSPYFPSSRRWYDPLLLAIEDLPEYAAAPATVRATVDVIATAARVTNGSDRIDRDAVWEAKRDALERLFPYARTDELAAYRKKHGDELERFAAFCALAEVHGASWKAWPDELRRPDSPAALAAREELADRISFYAWTQFACAAQLPSAQAAATASGMRIGLIHDLAVGVDSAGADGWALQDVLALGASAGAPPDPFSEKGQDWGVPPWHPRRIAEVGYTPLRDMLRAVLANGGGIRMDHVMGFFRLWWVPAGHPATDGGYVRYDAEAMVAAVTLEAHRAGAIVVGEDLGTVEPHVREAMRARGWLGSDVVWFTRDGNSYSEPGSYRRNAVASLTTHDLPTAAGFLSGAHIDLRAELDQLAESEDAARASWHAERDGLLAAMVREGVVAAGADLSTRVEALHDFLGRVESVLVLVSPYDVLGDLRQPNLPGTIDEYPNWRLPLATTEDGAARPVSLDEFWDDPRVRRVAATLASRNSAAPLP